MRLLIKETLYNMHINDDKNSELFNHTQNLSNENYRGNIYDIDAFSVLTEFSIILVNEDYTFNKNINIIKNDNPVLVYLIGNYDENHFEALISKNNNLYLNYDFNKNMVKIIENKIISKFNENKDKYDKIIEEKKPDNIANSNLKQENNKKNTSYDLICNIYNFKNLKKFYNTKEVSGDANCLFYSLSLIIFGDSGYYHTIRLAICNFYENNKFLKEHI